MDHPLDARVERKTNIFDLFSLKGKKAMVTKAADGIGKSSAMAFAEAGADLALLGDERDSDQLERLAEELEERFDVKVAVFCCNNLEDEQLDALREELLQEMGTIDVAHINTRIQVEAEALVSEERWKLALHENLDNIFQTGRLVQQLMQEHRGGSIIFTFSAAESNVEEGADTFCPLPDAAYDSAKTAISQYARMLAAFSARKGIRVNTLCPKPSWTVENQVPLGETGLGSQIESLEENEKLQGVLLFLASDASSSITGAHIPVGGGFFS